MYFLFVSNVFLLPYIYYGTGSYPDPPHGWHLRIRRSARYEPFSGPCLMSACLAYSEQVGVNRHEGGVYGLMNI